MIKAIIFDLDGTLLNTLEDIHFVLNESLNKFGLPELSLNQTMAYVGNGAKVLISRAVGERSDLFDKVYQYYAKKFSECDNSRTKLYDNEEKTLFALKELNIKFAIITNKPQRATENVYAKFLSKFEFSEVLGQTEYYPLKPDPALTLAIIDKFKLKKTECIFVGDGETDVQTAKAAGIKCVSALWGYRTREQLELAGGSIFANNFLELINIVNNKI